MEVDRMPRALLVLVAVASVSIAVSMRAVLWAQQRGAPAITAADLREKRAEWDLDSLAHGKRMTGLWYSDDGQTLWMGSASAGLLRWDPATRKATEVARDRDGYWANAWSRSGIAACTAGGLWLTHGSGALECRDSTTGKRLATGSVVGWHFVRFSPDGRRLVYTRRTGREDESCLLNLDAGGTEIVLDLGRLEDASFSPDGSRLVTRVRNGRNEPILTLRDGISGQPIGASSPCGYSCTFCLMGDGKRVAVHEDNILRLLDLSTGRLEASLPVSVPIGSHDEIVALSPDDRQVAILDQDGRIVAHPLSPTTPTVRIRPQEGPSSWYGSIGESRALAFSPDGKRRASASRGAVRIWDVQSGREETALVWYRDGGWMAVHSEDGTFTCSPGAEKHLAIQKGTTLFRAASIIEQFHASP